jgi:hypothetical protein
MQGDEFLFDIDKSIIDKGAEEVVAVLHPDAIAM